MSSKTGFGTTQIGVSGRGYSVGIGTLRYKAGGVTIDWSTVTAVGSDTTLVDGQVVKNGQKYILAGTILQKITASGKYGPADTTASDGRQLVTADQRGRCWILDRTVVDDELHSDLVGQVFDAGQVYRARIQMAGTNQPTLANAELMLPGISFIE